MPPVLIGGTHIHEMVSYPLVRKGLRLVSCINMFRTLAGVRERVNFM